jgi:S-adenosylmethionine:tRNA ribosyltransferase-isomerase
MVYTLDTYDYSLPNELIATHPVTPRDAARLYVWPENHHKHFYDLADYLQEGDVLVINNSKVIPARLRGIRRGREQGHPDVSIEILLHKPWQDFSKWIAFAKPTKRLREGDRIEFDKNVTAKIIGRDESQIIIEFNLPADSIENFLEEQGDIPLPPYIDRPTDAADKTEYQTVYVDEKNAGSVAAPTAGLHFTNELLDRLTHKGIVIVPVTLHVGAGTFLPVMVDDIRQHKMHSEWGSVSQEAVKAIQKAKANGKSVVAVGTTATRLLETAAQGDGTIKAWQGDTAIFITPGFKFQIVDRLVTNFHLPKSTLLMLVSAFMGDVNTMQRLYKTVMDHKYRFYSYGDACLLTRP